MQNFSLVVVVAVNHQTRVAFFFYNFLNKNVAVGNMYLYV